MRGREVWIDAGGFIGRADLEGRPDMQFVVYCQGCGERSNALAREHGPFEPDMLLAELSMPYNPTEGIRLRHFFCPRNAWFTRTNETA